jgi:hypothetical protein
MEGGVKEVAARDTYEPTADLLEVPVEMRKLTIREVNGTGEDKLWWPNVVQWARNDLKKRGHLAPSGWGYWRLSEKGTQTYETMMSLAAKSNLPFPKWVDDYISDH